MSGTTIQIDTLKDLVDSGEKVAFVDTTPADEFERGHIPGAINIPVERLEELAPVLLPDRDVQVVTYGRDESSIEPVMATAGLWSLGYSKFASYQDGKAGWVAAGFELEAELART